MEPQWINWLMRVHTPLYENLTTIVAFPRLQRVAADNLITDYECSPREHILSTCLTAL